jgi:hypothetical protein
MADWQSRLGGKPSPAQGGDAAPATADTGDYIPPLRQSYEQDTLPKALARGQLRAPEAVPVSFREHVFASREDWHDVCGLDIDTTPGRTAVGYGQASIHHVASLLGGRASSRIDRAGEFHDIGLIDLAKFFYERQMWKELDIANDMATNIVSAYDHHHRMDYMKQLENHPVIKRAFDSAERTHADLLGLATIIVDKEMNEVRTRR